MRDLAHAIAAQLGVEARPVEAEAPGFLKLFAGLDEPASSEKTQERYGWRPTGTSLLDTLNQGIDLDFAWTDHGVGSAARRRPP